VAREAPMNATHRTRYLTRTSAQEKPVAKRFLRTICIKAMNIMRLSKKTMRIFSTREMI
jgi:hypothetical protein